MPFLLLDTRFFGNCSIVEYKGSEVFCYLELSSYSCKTNEERTPFTTIHMKVVQQQVNSDDKRQGLIYTDDRVTISVIHLVYTRKSIFRVEPGPYNMSNKMLNTLSNSGNSKASDS